MPLVFFFKDPATPGIYTYGHPLSLPDALPILGYGPQGRAASRRRPESWRGVDWRGVDRSHPRPAVAGRCRWRPLAGEPILLRHERARRGYARSEEHTSELQSLMRISYAVFCLKKKMGKANVCQLITIASRHIHT